MGRRKELKYKNKQKYDDIFKPKLLEATLPQENTKPATINLFHYMNSDEEYSDTPDISERTCQTNTNNNTTDNTNTNIETTILVRKNSTHKGKNGILLDYGSSDASDSEIPQPPSTNDFYKYIYNSESNICEDEFCQLYDIHNGQFFYFDLQTRQYSPDVKLTANSTVPKANLTQYFQYIVDSYMNQSISDAMINDLYNLTLQQVQSKKHPLLNPLELTFLLKIRYYDYENQGLDRSYFYSFLQDINAELNPTLSIKEPSKILSLINLKSSETPVYSFLYYAQTFNSQDILTLFKPISHYQIKLVNNEYSIFTFDTHEDMEFSYSLLTNQTFYPLSDKWITTIFQTYIQALPSNSSFEGKIYDVANGEMILISEK